MNIFSPLMQVSSGMRSCVASGRVMRSAVRLRRKKDSLRVAGSCGLMVPLGLGLTWSLMALKCFVFCEWDPVRV